MFNMRGEEEMKIPVEMVIPDYRELDFANVGFMPLIYRKGTADACFFSCQSLKKSKKFKDPKDSENSQLVTNLSYTLSITRIAHYVKCIMRDNIGTSADATYIGNTLNNWMFKYVTTVVNPDDLTLRYYPFKAASVSVVERPGMIGWYDCSISVLPHIQFEGMDVELRLDARL
ncbi:MAG: type VI secretion system contractile sheath large subunit [Methylococcaceae bacterium]